ncbi:MAG: peptidyl-prolyl cis-trans isomerase [Candidatus Omnitrophica bacterium]|nr:peptidyl-prolyl cis-trans isomerase [Candidatus Omnitrophota bacterium]
MFRKLMASHAAKRRAAWIIFALLVLPFAIYGVSTRFTDRPAGTVFGKPISQDEFQAQRAWVLRQMQTQFGEAAEALDSLGAFVTQTTWDRILLAEEAKRRRVRVNDLELARFLQEIPALQEGGRFDRQRYLRYITAVGTTPQEFERLLRHNLTVDKLVSSVRSAVTVTEEQVRQAYERANEQLTAAVIFFDIERFLPETSAAATEEAVRAAFDAHSEAYREPERISFEYAGKTREEIPPPAEITEQELDAFYHDHPEQWPTQEDGTPKPLEELREQVRQRVASEKAGKQLTALALDLQDDVDAKRPFEEMVLARGLTKRAAGPLAPDDPWASQAPEPALLYAAAKLAEGEVSPVVQTDRGVYVVRLTVRQPARVPPFEQVREQVRQRVIRDRAKELARDRANRLHEYLTKQLADGKPFEEASAAYETPVAAASFTFTRSGSIGPLGAVAAANEAAFATPLGSLTAVLEAPTGYAILRPQTRIPADPAKFAEAEEALRKETLAAQQSERLNQWLSEVRARARVKSFVDSS